MKKLLNTKLRDATINHSRTININPSIVETITHIKPDEYQIYFIL